jgi:hypothetical protein
MSSGRQLMTFRRDIVPLLSESNNKKKCFILLVSSHSTTESNIKGVEKQNLMILTMRSCEVSCPLSVNSFCHESVQASDSKTGR